MVSGTNKRRVRDSSKSTTEQEQQTRRRSMMGDVAPGNTNLYRLSGIWAPEDKSHQEQTSQNGSLPMAMASQEQIPQNKTSQKSETHTLVCYPVDQLTLQVVHHFIICSATASPGHGYGSMFCHNKGQSKSTAKVAANEMRNE